MTNSTFLSKKYSSNSLVSLDCDSPRLLIIIFSLETFKELRTSKTLLILFKDNSALYSALPRTSE